MPLQLVEISLRRKPFEIKRGLAESDRLLITADAVHWEQPLGELIVEVRGRGRDVQPHSPEQPLTVTIGMLTEAEFQQLSPMDQESVETSTKDLVARCSQAWIRKEWRRLRYEIEFAYGV